MKHPLIDSSFTAVAGEMLGSIPSVRIVGKSTTEIVNHKGLRSFDEKQIQVMTKVGILCVEGFGLEVTGISDECIRIQGDIRRIFYQ